MTTGRDSEATDPRVPRRKRVVLADRRGTREIPRTMMELEEQNSVGEALVSHLMKVQLRSSLLLAGIIAVALCGLPVLFWLVPAVAEATVFGVSLPWLLLGVLPFPFMVLIGYLSTRDAERHEREFLRMVEK
ncbi:hypothetical protein DFQ14_101637 [Halopolyspora algeriensis]|uniref:DUF485 domain-containing protein n=1 Tax=Halopolyspora algeriensis TaxID=1500506 RepID=A0A368VZ58_9ACTN|nr:hypothetical protein [Halopolyspora algeriensis]RCW47287.1 hypothetical protein DFQ14_101637 [Halopolyspora algeriensis]TQM42522.1 hypothetical protein FHU43_4155 [Halopolyspora algeriensis]